MEPCSGLCVHEGSLQAEVVACDVMAMRGDELCPGGGEGQPEM